MATHRPHHTAFPPDFEFQVAIGVLEASETLAARRRPITPDTLARQFRAPPFTVRPTVAQIEHGLAQVQRWRTQILIRDILDHRGQLVRLGARLQVQQRQLDEDQFYLDLMLREADAVLQNTLMTPSEEEPGPARASANER
ncbi:MAG: hypothetical protein IPL99_08710 [Candidatus Competibacteraceae bacterium]|nr:hypothetical protein [Candidatus Competibacteraceae bacterium]